MFISVIIPVYNGEKGIEKAIQSVLSQKRNSIELILVDGGSTDNTMSIIKLYADKISRYISEKDSGYAEALNKGIALASGDYILMLAADDRLLPHAIERIEDSIKEDTDIWCGAILQRLPYGIKYWKSNPDLEKLYHGCSLRHPAAVFRRKLFALHGGYDMKYKCAADRELFLRLYTKGAAFQVENIPVTLFASEGISDKNALTVAFPEDAAISEEYGVSMKQIEEDKRRNIKKYKFSNRIILCKLVLAKLGLLSLIYHLFGKGEACMNKKDLKNIGLSMKEITPLI